MSGDTGVTATFVNLLIFVDDEVEGLIEERLGWEGRVGRVRRRYPGGRGRDKK